MSKRPAPKPNEPTAEKRGAAALRLAPWVGGIVEFLEAVEVADEPPARFFLLLWGTTDGLFLGHALSDVPFVEETIRASWDETVVKSATLGRAPASLRVTTDEIRAALASVLPAAVSVEVGPTPEVDTFASAMAPHLGADLGDDAVDPKRAGHLDAVANEGGPDAARASRGLFRSAAALYRAAPWSVLPSDSDLLEISIPALVVERGVLSVIGQAGEAKGVLFLHNLQDFETYFAAVATESAEEAARNEAAIPPHIGLTFDASRHVDSEVRRLIKARGFEVASADAFPSVLAIDGGARPRRPSDGEQLLMEVVAASLAQFFEDKAAVRRAFRTDRVRSLTVTAETSRGPIEVTLRGPIPGEDEAAGSEADDALDEDALAEVFAKEVTSPDEAVDLGQALLEAFADAPEAEAFVDVGSIGSLVLLAWSHERATPLTLTPEQLGTCLLTHFPHEVAMPPEIALEVQQIYGAFFAFLARLSQPDEQGRTLLQAPHAAANAALLDDTLMRSLWSALADRTRFSEEKAKQMAGVPLTATPPKPKGPLSRSEKNKQKAARKKR
jgi:hypothetical protein